MAGICAGPGLDVVGGKLQLAGARSVAWPSAGAACALDVANGLRVDPDTGIPWVPPDARIIYERGIQTGADRTLVPATSATKQLSSLDLTMEAPLCRRSLFRGSLQGGFAGWRLYSGNLWVLQRYVTLSINGAPVAFTGMQDVSVIENNSGGAISGGGAIDGLEVFANLTAGQVVRVQASYQWDPVTFTDNAVNSLAWRAPQLQGVLWTHPE